MDYCPNNQIIPFKYSPREPIPTILTTKKADRQKMSVGLFIRTAVYRCSAMWAAVQARCGHGEFAGPVNPISNAISLQAAPSFRLT